MLPYHRRRKRAGRERKREGIDGEDRFQCQDVVNLAPGKRVGCAAMENPFLGSLKVSQPEPQCHCTAGC